MLEPHAAFVVASSLRVPGLGILAIPASPAPIWLTQYALHTAFALTLLAEDHLPQSITGTIEELTQYEEEVAYRTLLLDFNFSKPITAGNQLLVQGIATQFIG